MTDILARVDAAINDTCMCGCGTPLPPDGPSAYFATPECQTAWHQARTTDPHLVHGSVRVAEGLARWRPDLVTAAPPLRHLQPLPDHVADLVAQTAPPVGNKTVGFDPGPGRYVLRLDDDYRYVEQAVDPARLCGDPDTDRALFATVWSVLRRDLTNPAHTDPAADVSHYGGQVIIHDAEEIMRLLALSGWTRPAQPLTMRPPAPQPPTQPAVPQPGFAWVTTSDSAPLPVRDMQLTLRAQPDPADSFVGYQTVTANVWTILPGTDVEVLAPDPGDLYFCLQPSVRMLHVFCHDRVSTMRIPPTRPAGEHAETIGHLVYLRPVNPGELRQAVFRSSVVDWAETVNARTGWRHLTARDTDGHEVAARYAILGQRVQAIVRLQRDINTHRTRAAATHQTAPDPGRVAQLLDRMRSRHTGPTTTPRPPRRIDPQGTR